MAPSKSKLRNRKGVKKPGKDNEDESNKEMNDLFFGASGNGTSDFDFPMPPKMSKEMGKEAAAAAAAKKASVDDDDDDDDDEDDDDDDKMDSLPSKSKYNQKINSSSKKTNDVKLPQMDKGIKMGPLFLLLIMFGTTLVPVLFFVGDSMSVFLSKNNILGALGYRLGIGSVPRKRVLSFYEKHNPNKLTEVPKVLAKHYGDYPHLIRKLERKYQDYGYFIGWEQDEAPLRIIQEQLGELYGIWIQRYWNKYAPLSVRTRMRNVVYNGSALYRQLQKLWRKKIWPFLEPLFGIPDERTAAKQKRQDAKKAQDLQRQRERASGTSRRKKNTDFRDEDEESSF